MSELKMSEVFLLPVNGLAKKIESSETNQVGCDGVSEFDAIDAAINSYDSHTEQIAKLTKDVEMLRGAALVMRMNLNRYNNPPPAVKESIDLLEKALTETEPSKD